MTTASQPYTLTLKQHTAILLFFRHKRLTFKGTFEQCESAYNRVRKHNRTFGWWGIVSPLFNWLALSSNKKAMNQLRALAGRQS